ncbi:MAG TPA: peptide deformylase [Gemmataceae bacterium]|nr:peptide deformylase [Gemmataceae bacterium]
MILPAAKLFRQRRGCYNARMNAASLKLVHYPHPALRRPARPITAIDKDVQAAAERMLEIMYEHNGLGLAAPQVSWPFQMTVINPIGDPEQKEHELVLINPVILEKKGTIEGEEGCLSFPGLFQKVRRAKTVKVTAYNLRGEAIEIASASDLHSRLLQHEIDHLHGTLYIDKMGTLAKLSSRSALRELEVTYRKAQERGEIPPNAEIERMLKAMEEGTSNGTPPPSTPPPTQPPIM